MMDCERIDLLLGLVEDELDAAERASVEAHLEGCTVCTETVDAYRGTAGAVRDLPAPQPSEEARARAYAAVMELMAQDAPAEAPKEVGPG